MYDPMTVAWEIKYPWYRKSKASNYKFRDSFLTIWHVDPEINGSDDSCGWSSPRLTKKEIELIKKEIDFELKYLFDEDDKGFFKPKAEPIAGIYESFRMVAWWLYRKRIKPKHLPEILNLSTNHFDSFRGLYEQKEITKYDIERQFFFIARCFKRMERKWWQHPRYHYWHFKIQIHPLQKFKRWAFSRCCKCGKGFSWSSSVSSNVWHSTGPLWFRSEKDLMHDRCSGISVSVEDCEKPAPTLTVVK